MGKRIWFAMLTGALLLWSAGCSDNPAEPELTDNLNLADEFGGYTTAVEQPGFGDDELLDMEGDEADFEDAMLGTPEVQSYMDLPECGRFHLRAVWGQLRFDPTVTEPTEWVGSLSISRGAILVRRLICWELNQDFLLPRTDRQLVEWQTTTTVHHDGLAFDIFVPPAPLVLDTTIEVDEYNDTTYIIDTLPPEPVVLSFVTGQYSRSITLSELAALDTVVFLEDSNAVAMHGFQVFPNVCPRGILAGHWGYDEDGKGVFRGVWRSQAGFVTGFLRGHFGVNDQGDEVFFGKWINRSGQFEGFLRGHYGLFRPNGNNVSACNADGGWFAGRIFDAQRKEIGKLAGVYRSAEKIRYGWFHGRWKLGCHPCPTLGINEFDFGDGF